MTTQVCADHRDPILATVKAEPHVRTLPDMGRCHYEIDECMTGPRRPDERAPSGLRADK
jgi:hypothetical protein